MINKYYVGGKIFFLKPQLKDYITAMYNMNERYMDYDILESWLHKDADEEVLYSELYFEVRNEIKNKIDYYKLKTETVAVIDYLCSLFHIKKENILITFNGEDGFYLRVNGFAGMLHPGGSLEKTVKCVAQDIKEQLNIDSIMLDIYEPDSNHVLFGNIKIKTGLFLNDISYEMLNEYSYFEISTYCTEKSTESYSEICDDTNELYQALMNIVGEYVDDGNPGDIGVWLQGYKPYKKLRYQEYIDLFSDICRNDQELLDLAADSLNDFDELMKDVNTLDEKSQDEAYRKAVYETSYNFVLDLACKYGIIYATYCEDEDMVLIHKGQYYENSLLCLNHYFIGNEDIYFEFNTMPKNKRKEEFFTVISMIYMHLHDYLYAHYRVIK